MHIISDKDLYEQYYFSKSLILDDKNYRKIRNDNFKPDKYIGLLNKEGTEFTPLVCKNNMVSFYGGFFYNEPNYIYPKTVNEVLNYLLKKKYNFRLLNLEKDIFNELNYDLRKYDVPYKQNWSINSIKNFDENAHFLKLKKLNKKKSDRFRRAIIKQDQYCIERLLPSNKKKIKYLVDLISESFKKRGLPRYEWLDNKLLFEILDFFHKQNNLYFFTMHHSKQKDVGWFCFVKNNNCMQNILFNVINRIYENDVFILFIKMLGVLRKSDAERFDFMSGNFGYKDICGCTYKPLFALVNDPKWKNEYNKDVEKKHILSKINRDYGCFAQK